MKNADDIPVHNLPDLQFLASDNSPAFGEHVPSHRISFFAIVWFCEDRGTHYIDFEPLPVKANLVYLIGKNQVHSLPDAALPRSRTIVFSGEFFDQIEEHYLRQLFLPFDNKGVRIPDEMVGPLSHLFELILLEYRSNADPRMLLRYTTALLTHLYRFEKSSSNLTAGDDSRMQRLFHLLDENYKEKKLAKFYASQIGLTTKRINEILRERMGTTISQLLYQLLLIEAKRELFHNRRSIKEIAYELGFSEQSYFARFFKKYTGTTPEHFRAHATEAFGMQDR